MATLVTGGCGFVGINLVEALAARGERVVVVDRCSLPGAAGEALDARRASIEFVEADTRETSVLERAMREHRVERVVHAAVITSGASRESSEPGEIISVNLSGAVAMLEAARSVGCRRILYVSSGSAYGRTLDESGPLLEESSPSRPETLYGITKYAAERTVLRLGELWRLDVVCARLGSVFGPWEHGTGARDRLSPQLQIARLALEGACAVLPRKEVLRDWIYSRDVAAGLLALLFAERTPNALYHLGAGQDWSGFFPRWCDALRAAYPGFSWRVAGANDSPNVNYHADRDRARMDIRRIAADTRFVPRFGPEAACEDFLAWIRAHESFVASRGEGP